MNTVLHLQGRPFPTRLIIPESLLCLPRAKTPRLVGDWAEEDGLEYDLSEPLWLEELPLQLLVKTDYRPTPGDRPALEFFGRQLPLDILHATPHAPHPDWTELRARIADLSTLFGAGGVNDDAFSEEELRRFGLRVLPDWDALQSEPEQKVAFERPSKVGHGTHSALAPGRKARTITLQTWAEGADCIQNHLTLCRLLRERVAGQWSFRGRDFFLRYQAMEVSAFLPGQLVASRLTLQQYRY